MSKIMLDSNTYTHLFKGDKKVEEELVRADSVYMSVIVIGELLAAFKGGIRYSKNKAEFQLFLDKFEILFQDVNRETANIYGEIKYYLDKRGTPIPANDLWIASQAIETGSVLITYDKHFLKIPGLRIWDKLE